MGLELVSVDTYCTLLCHAHLCLVVRTILGVHVTVFWSEVRYTEFLAEK